MEKVEMIFMAITVVAMVVFAIGIVIASKPVKVYLGKKLEKEQYDTLIKIAEIGVQWAEQWLGAGQGKVKKEQVIVYITDKCAEYGLDVTEEDIDKAIESAVLKLK